MAISVVGDDGFLLDPKIGDLVLGDWLDAGEGEHTTPVLPMVEERGILAVDSSHVTSLGHREDGASDVALQRHTEYVDRVREDEGADPGHLVIDERPDIDGLDHQLTELLELPRRAAPREVARLARDGLGDGVRYRTSGGLILNVGNFHDCRYSCVLVQASGFDFLLPQLGWIVSQNQ